MTLSWKGVLLGLSLGILLVVTSKGHISDCHPIHKSFSAIVNIFRSFPFIILIVILLPLSRLLIVTTLGATAAVVPLSIGSAPFLARIIENSLMEVDKGKIEAALEILEFVKPILKKQGINLQVVVLDDEAQLNPALQDKQIDANYFQHLPYLNAVSKGKGYQFAVAGKIHVEPIGFYSQKIKSKSQLKKGAKIAIPFSPSNEYRALALLEANGLIKLKDRSQNGNLSGKRQFALCQYYCGPQRRREPTGDQEVGESLADAGGQEVHPQQV